MAENESRDNEISTMNIEFLDEYGSIFLLKKMWI